MDLAFMSQALARLCKENGGHKKVGQLIGVNPQTIHQIISGVKLPSGNPRGVGPSLRAKLDQFFPGWMSEGGANVREVRFGYPVPVISNIRAGSWGEINDHEPDTEEVFYTRDTKPKKSLFALRVEGDSMKSSSGDGDTFPDGRLGLHRMRR